jgi:excisionase family DNA binding protein
VNLELSDNELDQLADKLAERLAAKLQPAEPSPYLSIPEAADYLRCSRHRIDDLLSARRLRRVKEGRRTLIRRDELARYIEDGNP